MEENLKEDPEQGEHHHIEQIAKAGSLRQERFKEILEIKDRVRVLEGMIKKMAAEKWREMMQSMD